jgi:myosin tail region-interacting protein MTI1
MFNLNQMSNYLQVNIILLFQFHNFISNICIPVRKSSENVSVHSTDSSTRSPHSMPVPTVPRRAGPPRKKSVKPPPEVPEAPVEEAIAAPSVISMADDYKAVESEEEAVLVPKQKESESKIIDDHRAEIHDEPRSIDSDVQPAEELVVESKPASSGESKEQGPAHDIQFPPPDELKQEHKHEHEQSDHPDQPSDVDTIRKGQAEDDEILEIDEHSDYDEKLSVEHHEDKHLQRDDDHYVGAEPQPNSAIGATGTDEDAEEEEVRRKRVAERLAKMGGINPFALPPSRLPSSEETGHADSSVVSSHASPESLPVSPDIPTRKASSPSHDVAESLPLAVKPKVEEQGAKEDGE